jgi:hypothetical protein
MALVSLNGVDSLTCSHIAWTIGTCSHGLLSPGVLSHDSLSHGSLSHGLLSHGLDSRNLLPWLGLSYRALLSCSYMSWTHMTWTLGTCLVAPSLLACSHTACSHMACTLGTGALEGLDPQALLSRDSLLASSHMTWRALSLTPGSRKGLVSFNLLSNEDLNWAWVYRATLLAQLHLYKQGCNNNCRTYQSSCLVYVVCFFGGLRIGPSVHGNSGAHPIRTLFNY